MKTVQWLNVSKNEKENVKTISKSIASLPCGLIWGLILSVHEKICYV